MPLSNDRPKEIFTRTKKFALQVFITLATIAYVTVIQTLPPSSLPASVPAAEFSAERAILHIQAIAI